MAAAEALSEIGYLLRQDEKERFRAKAFSAAGWSIALQEPDLEALHEAGRLTSIEGVGEGIARVLAGLIETGESRDLKRLREQMKQPARDDGAELDLAGHRGGNPPPTRWRDGRGPMLEQGQGGPGVRQANP